MAKRNQITPDGKSGRAKTTRKGPLAPCSAVQGSTRGRKADSASLRGKAKTPPKIASQAVGETMAGVPAGLARILRPGAAQRWTLPSLAAITPQYVETVLRGAMAGSHVQLWELCDLMMDSWPEMAGCCAELTEGVMARKVVFRSWEEDGEKPTPSAEERKAVVSGAIRRMRPNVAADENDFEDTLRDIADGWLRGTVCLEADWHAVTMGKLGRVIAPRATMFAHPSFFAWSKEGYLGLRTGNGVQPMPPHKFLVGIHKARAGSAMGNALLRPLAWWWCAANFASDWLLNLAQLFGLPFRWANHDPNASQETVDAICNMLQNMGSAGWAAFPAGTTMELKDAGKSGDSSPQGDLLDRADRYARMLILGQTMSGSQDASKGGGKAFGSVEAGVKDERIDAAAKYVAKVVNSQLIPFIVELNFGDTDECPCIDLVPDQEAGQSEATRDETLSRMMPIGTEYLRSKYGVPKPAEGEETTNAHAKPEDGGQKPEDGGQKPEEEEEDEVTEMKAKAAALLAITDDALFAKELRKLTKSLK